MPLTWLDHLTVTAPDLDSGADHVQRVLGVPLQPGGEHPRMGTHNRLLRIGPGMFLEVIAVNPAAPAPARPRWFGLDRLAAGSAPRLATWVARGEGIASLAAQAGDTLGAVEPMSRGLLNWLITIPQDGNPPWDGLAPALIEWQAAHHPADKLEDRGIQLTRLELAHLDPAGLRALLTRLDCDGPLHVRSSGGAAPWLRAHFDTPAGPRQLGGPD